ncbi:MAG: aminotransferase class III-fold pyridoxal phosphate-dependent enzyme [Candidatus Riflebacteria bacterium]|nr:aminotransferase class III-fold pyridoxal phosphate-dependent enzyme [Candidatus Riflebacteria bacterium]
MLLSIRRSAGSARTTGLDDSTLKELLSWNADLGKAIESAVSAKSQLMPQYEQYFKMEEAELCKHLQEKILNFYPTHGINPYVPLGGYGSWIITTHGAVLHDSGGYGMLGLGHAPEKVLEAMNKPYVMANVMTPSLSQKNLTDRLVKEIGRKTGKCPFSKFVFLNSGSESVTFTCRVTDIHARKMTDPGARHAGKKVAKLAIIESFHGRTEGPARLSHSTRPAYTKHLASFRDSDNMVFVPVNDIQALKNAFSKADQDGVFFEAIFVEPVMGEGVPGLAITRSFYDEARKLANQMESLLIVDSIQAALRAQACLSIIDYNGFENCEPPDMETYSKALNAGQYPLSVVAMRSEISEKYIQGLYGNTMTTNPRAMEVACTVLDSITEETRANIHARGKEFLDKFNKLNDEFPGAVEKVVGTGLMVCIMLNPKQYRVTGKDGFEEYLRIHGIEMIHGSDYGLRFTPSFNITSKEIDLIVEYVKRGLKELPARNSTYK